MRQNIYAVAGVPIAIGIFHPPLFQVNRGDALESPNYRHLFHTIRPKNICILQEDCKYQPYRGSDECILIFADILCESAIRCLKLFASNPDSYREIHPVICFRNEV